MKKNCETCKHQPIPPDLEPCLHCLHLPPIFRRSDGIDRVDNWQPAKPIWKELQAEIDRLKKERDYMELELAGRSNEIYQAGIAHARELAAKDAEIAELRQRISEDAPKQQVASEKPDLLPVGTKVMVKYDKDIYAATIINIDRHDTTVPYFVRFGDGEERWVRRRRVTSIPADLLPVGTRVMLTGTIIGLDERDDEYPYGVELDHDSEGEWWLPKSSIKPLNHD